MQENEINLQQFCAEPTAMREQLKKPFASDGFTVATDGRILVRVALSDYPSEPVENQPTKKSIESLGAWNHDAITDWVEVPELPEPQFSTCKRCEGTGKRTVCQECDGSGEHECECGDLHSCPKCQGHGLLKGKTEAGEDCDNCAGTGKLLELTQVTVGAVLLNADYLRKIKTLPGAMLHSSSGQLDPLAFKFNDGMGYVMPMRK